ncbi:MAG: phenylalanine--tRNA ligase subunit alpha, partial [Oscillospiraceae bacterium]|nr:phenylalanine--tRNA ligase subunit alpha [Oscillospiraceae bacterium]
MKEQLHRLEKEALGEITQAADEGTLEALRVKYLGKKGELTAILKQMGSLPAQERPVIGEAANLVREALTKAIEEGRAVLGEKAQAARLAQEKLDVTIPGKAFPVGKKHPLTTVLDEAKDIFISMGFTIAEGPEIELSVYDFDKLNIPANHTVRDWQ